LAELGTVYRYERSGGAAGIAARARIYARRTRIFLHAVADRSGSGSGIEFAYAVMKNFGIRQI